jgi:alpha-L-arabinofuranosidase
MISEHFYCRDKEDIPQHVQQIPNNVKKIADAHRKLREELPSLKGKDIRIALDEWNYWYGPHVFGELGTRYFLKDALGIAAGLHEYFRNSDIIFMANYAHTVNVIGTVVIAAPGFAGRMVILPVYSPAAWCLGTRTVIQTGWSVSLATSNAVSGGSGSG